MASVRIRRILTHNLPVGFLVAIIAYLFFTLVAYALTGEYTSLATIGNPLHWFTLSNQMGWVSLGFPHDWSHANAAAYNMFDTILIMVLAMAAVFIVIGKMFNEGDGFNFKVAIGASIGAGLAIYVIRAILAAL